MRQRGWTPDAYRAWQEAVLSDPDLAHTAAASEIRKSLKNFIVQEFK